LSKQSIEILEEVMRGFLVSDAAASVAGKTEDIDAGFHVMA